MKETVDDCCLRQTEMAAFKICQGRSCTPRGSETKITSYSFSWRSLEPGSTWPTPLTRNFCFAVGITKVSHVVTIPAGMYNPILRATYSLNHIIYLL